MIRLLAALLAVPLIAFAVSRGLLYKFNSDWRSAVQAEIDKVQIPPESEAAHADALKTVDGMRVLQETSLDVICADPKFSDMWTGCGDVQTMSVLSTGAIVTAALGVALVLLIGFAGRLSRSSRLLLLFLFRPGLYLTILALSVIILLHAALAMGSLYYGESALVGRIHVGIMLAIALGALAGTAAMLRAAFGTLQRATTTVVGKKHDLHKDSSLQAFLSDLTAKVGTAMPDNVVVGLTPNFFVTEANVRCLDGVLSGRTLYLSLPLSRLLTRSEMASVLGHELGHYKGQDTRFSRKFYPIYRGTAESLAALAANVGEGARATALFPALWTLSYFYDCFASAEAKLGRERELAADGVGAQITNPRIMATALLKVCTFAPFWEGIQEQMKDALSQGKQFVNLSAYWAGAVQEHLREASVFDGIATKHLEHPTDSHPALGIRLAALHVAISDIETDALQTAPAHPAIELVATYEDFEKELTDVEHLLLAGPDAGRQSRQEGPPRDRPEGPQQCPKCGVINPATAEKCDCGEAL